MQFGQANSEGLLGFDRNFNNFVVRVANNSGSNCGSPYRVHMSEQIE